VTISLAENGSANVGIERGNDQRVKVFSFVEGANPRGGGLGLVGVPRISKSLADRGHEVVLNVAGRVIPGADQLIQPDVNCALHPKSEAGVLSIVTYPAYGRWAFSPTMLWALRRHAADADFIYLHSLYSFPIFVGYLLARIYHKPYGLSPHGVLAPFQRGVSAGKKRIYDWIIARRILNEAYVLFYSAVGERDEARSLGLRSPSVIIPHGFDIQEYLHLPSGEQFRSKYLKGHQGPLVLFLSRLNAKKGLDLLIQAFSLVIKKMPDVRLAIVGSGDPPKFEMRIRSWLKEYGVENYTIMTGFISGPEKLMAFSEADVFVLPSQAENFGFANFEAMASKIPVVISDTLNYANEIKSYQAGLVVRRDPKDFAEAILKLLKDKYLRQRLGQNGLRLAYSYSWEACGEKVEQTIQCILQGKPLTKDLTLEE
jgi:glycosyltransferase involved in cell wall biosynthesis